MSVRREQRGNLPAPATLLGEYEQQARKAAAQARDTTRAAVRSNYPKGTGRSAREIRGSVSRTPDGLAVNVAPPRARAHIYRFVEAGTGVEGPRGRLIPPRKRGRLPSGRVPTGRGQRPQWPFERTRTQLAGRVSLELQRAAGYAGEILLRKIGGGR